MQPMPVVSGGAETVRLVRCRGRHPQTMRVCDPHVFACHDEFCPLGEDGAQNPVLAYIGMLRGTRLLALVDLSDVDGIYQCGERIIELHGSAGAFTTGSTDPITLYTVTERTWTGEHCVCVHGP